MTKVEKYEEFLDNGNDSGENPNYMVIQNLKSIIEKSNEMLNMLNMGELDEWAKDHVATSNDDISEVYEFLKNKK
jgi:uncharacterized protein YfkK (UPF0435 family)